MLTGLISCGLVYYVALEGENTAEMLQFRGNFHIWGLFCPSPVTNPGKIWQQTIDPQSPLTCHISFESVYCVTFQGQKIAIWGKF